MSELAIGGFLVDISIAKSMVRLCTEDLPFQLQPFYESDQLKIFDPS